MKVDDPFRKMDLRFWYKWAKGKFWVRVKLGLRKSQGLVLLGLGIFWVREKLELGCSQGQGIMSVWSKLGSNIIRLREKLGLGYNKGQGIFKVRGNWGQGKVLVRV